MRPRDTRTCTRTSRMANTRLSFRPSRPFWTQHASSLSLNPQNLLPSVRRWLLLTRHIVLSNGVLIFDLSTRILEH
ncbi:hypothetical protein RSAG8_01460, partial [Rhizoctonia solani AG-8 WAC10335]